MLTETVITCGPRNCKKAGKARFWSKCRQTSGQSKQSIVIERLLECGHCRRKRVNHICNEISCIQNSIARGGQKRRKRQKRNPTKLKGNLPRCRAADKKHRGERPSEANQGGRKEKNVLNIITDRAVWRRQAHGEYMQRVQILWHSFRQKSVIWRHGSVNNPHKGHPDHWPCHKLSGSY